MKTTKAPEIGETATLSNIKINEIKHYLENLYRHERWYHCRLYFKQNLPRQS